MRLFDRRDAFFLAVIVSLKVLRRASPPRLTAFVAGWVGLAAYARAGDRRRLSERNLSRAFAGAIGERRAKAIVRKSYQVFWWDTLLMSSSPGRDDLLDRINIRGRERLEGALEGGKGVILWESRVFGRRHLAKQVLRRHDFGVVQVYGEGHIAGFADTGGSDTWARRHIVRPFFESAEREVLAGIIYIPKSHSLTYARAVLEHLRGNGIVCFAADGTIGQKYASAHLLGCDQAFPTGVVSLARISGAPILPLFCVAERGGDAVLIIEPPLPSTTGADRESGSEGSVRHYASLLDSYVRRFPAEYRHWHALRCSSIGRRSAPTRDRGGG
jgi:lauroyl/myristoyl acyltransferase